MQPPSTIHDSSYSDYSHSARLVLRDAVLDGERVDLLDVFQSPKLSPLVSDEGPYLPRLPSPPKAKP